MTPPGAYSHTDRILRIDRRTREGRLIADLRAKLQAQFPCANVVQTMAMGRAIAVYMRLLFLDRRLMEQRGEDGRGAALTAKAYNEANAMFVRLLGILDLDPTLPDAKPPPQPLDDYLRATAAQWTQPGANGSAAP